MKTSRAILLCGFTLFPVMASAGELAPVALNSLSKVPANIASLRVMDQKGQVVGQALQIQTDQDGHPAALSFRASNGKTVVISAAATSYDGRTLVTSNDQPQIAALSDVRTAAN